MRPVGRSGDRTTAANGRPRYPSGEGSPDVTVNRRSALRVGDPILDDRGNYRNGEATVLVNGRPLVARGDDASCDRQLVEASSDVVVGQGNIASPGQPPGILFHIHVDANRDGTVDDDFSRNGTWEAGRGRFGAILPVNADDDEIAPRPDVGGDYIVPADERVPLEDYRKPARRTLRAPDLPDVAPIDLRRDPRTAGRSTAGWKLVVVIARRYKMRIFDKRIAGGVEILGPDTTDRYEITNIDRDRYEWAMEGTQFAGRHPWTTTDRDSIRDFDGTVQITLEIWDPNGVKAHEEQCVVRATPWLMFTHVDPTDEVLVVANGDNGDMVDGLRAALAPTGVKLTRVALQYDDRWMQDVMEPGFSSLARAGVERNAWSKPIVLRSARHRPCASSEAPGLSAEQRPATDLAKLPRLMCGPDFGYAQGREPSYDVSSLDSFGNLECTPPFEHPTTGASYRLGRIVYGDVSPDIQRIDGGGMQAEVVAFLRAQRVQSPIAIETGWLNVGHVDEIISFIPMKDARLGFRVTVASPDLARTILYHYRNDAAAGPVRWLHPIDGDPSLAITDILALPHFNAVTDFVEGRIRRATDVLKTEIGLRDDDFIRLPVAFTARHRPTNEHVAWPGLIYDRRLGTTDEAPAFDHAIAQTPGVVNGLVVTRGEPTRGGVQGIVYVMPKPYGPVIRGRCAFEAEIVRALGPAATTGVTPAFIDDFFSYHAASGEVHCGTNSVRKPPIDRFWWEQDVV